MIKKLLTFSRINFKIFLFLFLLLASLGIYYASTTSAAVTDVPVGSQNISLNKRSWASSRVYNHVPGNAFDRKNETRWNSANADRQWICVNLGATQRVDKVLICKQILTELSGLLNM